MDLAELIRARRTVHSFKTDKVPDSIVDKALELSLWSMNHKLSFPWRYYRIGDAARNKLADLSVELKNAKEPLSETKRHAVRDVVLHPSHLIAIGIRRTADTKRMHEDYATLAGSVQIASLYLWQNGIASKWTTSGFTTHERTYEALGLSQEEVQLEGALMIGVPLIVPSPMPRPPLSQVLRQTP